jgi:tRNA dimethylallyltransferase
MEQPQLVIIAGPTATGKTVLAIELATRYGAEIVSADSRQVYRYLDIGTAKPTLAQQGIVPHHLIDVVNPDEPFDSARFRALAVQAIDNAVQRGKRVLVVGGTGLYLRALTRGLFAGPPADAVLRARLHEQEQSEGRGFLHRWLAGVDPEAAARLHPNDTVRLIRALEVFLLSGTPISRWQQNHSFRDRPFTTLTISLVMERRTRRGSPSLVGDGIRAGTDAAANHWLRSGRRDVTRALRARRCPGAHDSGNPTAGQASAHLVAR